MQAVTISPALERFLRHVAAHADSDTPDLDDALDLLGILRDKHIEDICGDALPVVGYFPDLECAGLRRKELEQRLVTVRTTGTLRERLADEMGDLYLDGHTEIDRLLAEGIAA